MATAELFSLTLSKRGGSFQEKESTQKYRIESRKEIGYLSTRIISVFKNERGGFFGEGDFFVAGAYGDVFDY